ncbi:hypothetical protein KM043_017171 [Ampulex compressa]|nr:hypothetical protein KM043_017171 [Ampulex compressa]
MSPVAEEIPAGRASGTSDRRGTDNGISTWDTPKTIPTLFHGHTTLVIGSRSARGTSRPGPPMTKDLTRRQPCGFFSLPNATDGRTRRTAMRRSDLTVTQSL